MDWRRLRSGTLELTSCVSPSSTRVSSSFICLNVSLLDASVAEMQTSPSGAPLSESLSVCTIAPSVRASEERWHLLATCAVQRERLAARREELQMSEGGPKSARSLPCCRFAHHPK